MADAAPVPGFRRVAQRLRVLVSEQPSLPRPGGGETYDRLEALAALAAVDLSVGRLAEGHYDAVAILEEAGAALPIAGVTYGVWAARSRRAPLSAEFRHGEWVLSGTKAFCSGAPHLDRALVTADSADGYRLFDISLHSEGVKVEADSWPAVGMADSESLTVCFDRVRVDATCEVGGPGFYLARPGFWHGAVGVAACWTGGARGLVDTLLAGSSPDVSPAVMADIGRAVTHVRTQEAVLKSASVEIDSDPADRAGRAAFEAQAARQAIHDSCVEVLALVASAGGARPLGHDAAQSRRAADLYVYLSQHHGGDDAAAVGKMALHSPPWKRGLR